MLVSNKSLDKVSLGMISLKSGPLVMPENYEDLYQLALHKYNQECYEVACKIFESLASYNNFDPRHMLGWAASLQMLKRYEEALGVYATAIFLTLDDPNTFMRMGDCLVALARKQEASECYEQALEFCVSDAHEEIRQHCTHGLQALRISKQAYWAA